VDSPRHAEVLLVAGEFAPGEVPGLAQVHDQLASPGGTVRWGEPLDGLGSFVQTIGTHDDVVAAIRSVASALYRHPEVSEPPRLEDVDPVEWRGVGPYGHGGTGMTGGTPYGRPMVERAPDRDGLELDQLPVTVGPWIGSLPPGMTIHVKLQGDIVQEAEVLETIAGPYGPDLFARALGSPQRVADLELARASHHLTWLGEALRVHGLPALGLRALRLSQTLGPDSAPSVRALIQRVRRSGIFRLALGGVGMLTDSGLDGLGPVSRAHGREDDSRLHEPVYRELGFTTVTHEGGDAAARWRQRLAEIDQSVDLAGRAGALSAFGAGVVESPRGRIESEGAGPSAVLKGRLADWLTGMEWGDAVTTIWSLDIDPIAYIPVASGAKR
ncbi:MAG TPA: hypothetical protein VIG24_11410, partial [Acidimicrobiia bacterium]